MTEQTKENKAKENKTKWHAPIYRGLQLDLRENALQFEDNISLSAESLEISQKAC